ncbi:MAG TPA: GntR family transcriptional regulator [Humibacillus xanthopallidus]|nr:GntR family transcriptional regulator [Humibacillus xanthopallidus]
MTSSTGPADPTPTDASERAYTALLSRISAGEILAGERLFEQSLAEALGVSRTPVRDALKRLAAEGLVDIEPYRGAQVVSFTPEDVAALYAMRAEFEPVAARLAVPAMSDADVERLAELAEQMERIVTEQGDAGGLTALNNSFHAIFVEGSGNRHLSVALKALFRPAVVTRTFRQYNQRALQRSMQHHAELVEAASARDGEWAEAVMRAHILSARHAVEWRPDPGDEDAPG